MRRLPKRSRRLTPAELAEKHRDLGELIPFLTASAGNRYLVMDEYECWRSMRLFQVCRAHPVILCENFSVDLNPEAGLAEKLFYRPFTGSLDFLSGIFDGAWLYFYSLNRERARAVDELIHRYAAKDFTLVVTVETFEPIAELSLGEPVHETCGQGAQDPRWSRVWRIKKTDERQP